MRDNVNMAPKKREEPYEPLGKHFISAWRESKTLNQDQVAEAIHMSRTNLSKIETFDSPYSQRNLEAMAKFFGCEPFELLIRDPNLKQGRGYLISLLMKLPDDQLDYIRGSLETAINIAKSRNT